MFQSLLMHVFQKLSYLLHGLCLSLSSLTLPQTVRLFNVSSHSQASTPCFPFLRCTVTNWPLHMHYGITLRAYLSQTHRPIALHCMHYGITLWAYHSEPLVKDSESQKSKFDEKTTIPHASTYVDHITITYMLRRGIQKHCTCEENGWLTVVAVSL